MDNNFASLINSAQSVLILLPNKPDFDQVAAGLALYLSLKEAKDISISCPSPILVEFNRLMGVDKITSELGNKNLTIGFNGYPADNIERVSADVINSEFKLTVIPKAGFLSPKKEQVELFLSGAAADLIILVGGEDESSFPQLTLQDLSGAKFAHIGLKPLVVSSDKSILSYATVASSLSEIIASLISGNGLSMDADIATNLMAGIEEASGHFAGEGVSANTFDVFANLLRAGGVRTPKEVTPQKPYPQGSIPAAPQPAPQPAPKDWFEPKIYKGTSVS
jgi:hypothetical protein